jgi:uncharacterized protein (DUF2336 family)
MTATASLLVELERAIAHGSRERRTETLRRITNLFLDRAESFGDEHVAVFDDVLTRLIKEIESKALSELSRKLAPIGNAPVKVVRRLAHDDDISVAAPVLQQSRRLAETDLVDIAKTKSQAHLLAISGRDGIGEKVTDVLVRRGDRDVARNVAENPDARLSENAFSTLVKRAEQDGVLAEKVGQRSDIPRGCSASSCCMPPRWCASGCSRPPRPTRRRRSGACWRGSPTKCAARSRTTTPPPCARRGC